MDFNGRAVGNRLDVVHSGCCGNLPKVKNIDIHGACSVIWHGKARHSS